MNNEFTRYAAMLENVRLSFAGETAAQLAKYGEMVTRRVQPDRTFNSWDYGTPRNVAGSYHINAWQSDGMAARLAFTYTDKGMVVKYDITTEQPLIGELSLSHDTCPSSVALALCEMLERHLTGRVQYSRSEQS